jgi:hypothetical protein
VDGSYENRKVDVDWNCGSVGVVRPEHVRR